MNSLSTTAVVLLAVLPVTTGAVLTAVFNFFSQQRIDRRDHEQWLRTQRFVAYTRLIEEITKFTVVRQSRGLVEQDHEAILKSATAAQTIAGKQNRAVIENFMRGIRVELEKKQYDADTYRDNFTSLRNFLSDEIQEK